MQLRFLVTIPLLAVLTFLGWPHSGHQSLSVAAREPLAAKVGVPPEVDTANLAAFLEQTAIDAYLAEEGAKVAEYLDALEATRVAEETQRRAVEEASARRAGYSGATTQPTATTSWPASLSPCGGDLPPCYVKQRESGGDYNARNPNSSASGAWQFLDSTWAGYGGYSRAYLAPPDVQDAKARQLWAGGAGCSHWSAC